jgi:hypothetical protein
MDLRNIGLECVDWIYLKMAVLGCATTQNNYLHIRRPQNLKSHWIYLVQDMDR